ncbi:LPS translocon maturation chaperone LptM [Terrihabitans sp. B22-R8]|uniref:LPS translocon maturation chaperone LptM n=1 Tax=Terrihabitans sp. B22-R8 TaxID=3425128 RepID=UPI00403C1C26
MTRRAIVTGAMVALVLIAVAGCGRKGPLELPEAATPAREQAAPAALIPAPTAYSSPQASSSSLLPPPTNTAAGAAEWSYQQPRDPLPVAEKPAKPAKRTKPDRPFILDSLLN